MKRVRGIAIGAASTLCFARLVAACAGGEPGESTASEDSGAIDSSPGDVHAPKSDANVSDAGHDAADATTDTTIDTGVDGANDAGSDVDANDASLMCTGDTGTLAWPDAGQLAITISIGPQSMHGCKRFADGTLKCWGYNTQGELGLGDNANRGDGLGEMGSSLPAVNVGTGRTVTQVSVGFMHTCALLDNGSVKCWGASSNGELGYEDTVTRGDGPNEMGDNLPAIDLGTGRTAKRIAAGDHFTCAILENDHVKCWGTAGILGVEDNVARGNVAGTMGDTLPEVNLGTGRSARDLACGIDFTCALLDDETVKCWGGNSYGQLGQGDHVSRGYFFGSMGDFLPAIDLGSCRHAKGIATGSNFACALLDDGTVKCWGEGDFGELGTGSTDDLGNDPLEMGDSLMPIPLGAGRTAKAIFAGGYSVCAILDDDSLKCWGSNAWGTLGIGDTANRGVDAGQMGDSLPSVNLGTGRTPKLVQSGYYHTCALLDDDGVKCWGYGILGQLGYGNTTDRGGSPSDMGDSLPELDLAP